jgi:hypothetical protein
MKLRNTNCGENEKLLNAKVGGTYSYDKALKD